MEDQRNHNEEPRMNEMRTDVIIDIVELLKNDNISGFENEYGSENSSTKKNQRGPREGTNNREHLLVRKASKGMLKGRQKREKINESIRDFIRKSLDKDCTISLKQISEIFEKKYEHNFNIYMPEEFTLILQNDKYGAGEKYIGKYTN
ncbi:hypothetical protein RF11_05674 [Thelohanellus kitauei]|uniref:Uncharacterized protein n=1 Tax=Thelohanellus kitauei TaxID=669202 RepID=A0A0C2I518_THEKT|nr:hypothetical protein RF11_05674 [Thelohanellus kitauei]